MEREFILPKQSVCLVLVVFEKIKYNMVPCGGRRLTCYLEIPPSLLFLLKEGSILYLLEIIHVCTNYRNIDF